MKEHKGRNVNNLKIFQEKITFLQFQIMAHTGLTSSTGNLGAYCLQATLTEQVVGADNLNLTTILYVPLEPIQEPGLDRFHFLDDSIKTTVIFVYDLNLCIYRFHQMIHTRKDSCSLVNHRYFQHPD